MAHAEKRGKTWRVKYKKPDGSYGSASKDDFGNRFTTKRLALKYGEALETDVGRNTFIDPRDGQTTLAAWIALWLKSIDVRPLTERDYRLRIKNYILPQWGNTKVRDLATIHIVIWEKDLRSRFSKNTADGILSVFRTIMADAVVSKLRADNPVPSHTTGRRGKFKPKPKNEKVIATPRQALLIARNAREMRGFNEYVLVLTKAYTGLRIGELAGIHRDHLALTDEGIGARILMSQQSQYVNGEFTEIEPKYDSGRGLIIPPFLAALLQELVDSRKSKWVFTAPKGGRLLRGGDWYKTTWGPIVEGRAPRPVVRGAKARAGIRPVLGVEGLVPHGLRHSHKTWLDESGAARVAVEARMGHTLPGVEGTYSHVTLDMELKIASILQELWEKSQLPEADDTEYGPLPEWISPGEDDLP